MINLCIKTNGELCTPPKKMIMVLVALTCDLRHKDPHRILYDKGVEKSYLLNGLSQRIVVNTVCIKTVYTF